LHETRLLLARPDDIAAELDEVRKLLRLPPYDGATAAAAAGGGATAAVDATAADAARVGANLLREVPALLLPGGRGAALRGRLAALADGLEVDVTAVARAAAANGEVLEAPAGGAAAALAALVGAGVGQQGRVAAMLLRQPALMHRSEEVREGGFQGIGCSHAIGCYPYAAAAIDHLLPKPNPQLPPTTKPPSQSLQSAAAAVLALLSTHAPWLDAFAASLDPAAAGLLLLQHRARLPLLLYLQQRGLQGRIGLAAAVGMGQRARNELLGADYGVWLSGYREQEERAARQQGGGEGGEEGGGDQEWGAEEESEEEGGSSGGQSDEDEEDEEDEEQDYQRRAPASAASSSSGSSDGSSVYTPRRSPAPARRPRKQGGPGPVAGGGISGAGLSTVRDGIMVGWPGAPNQRQRLVMRLQWAAGDMYLPETEGLLDEYWELQGWYRRQEEE
jgi:hypothetical protein